MSRRTVLLLIAGVVGLGAILAIGLSQTGTSNKAPTPDAFDLAAAQKQLAGAPAPLAALHAQASRLVPATKASYAKQVDGLRGHPIVVNKWASWCGPCRAEFPVLQSTSVKYGKQVAFLGLDSQDNDGDAKTFLTHFPVPYPSLVDRKSRIAQSLGISRAFPTTVFYGADGKVKYIHQGPYTTDAAFATDIEHYALGQPQ